MPARLLTVVRRLLSFAAGSSVGLVIDLGGFFLLVSAGVVPWLANAISSSAAVTAVYLLVTRYAFGTVRQLRTYVAFVAWYAFVIVVSSTSIQLLQRVDERRPVPLEARVDPDHLRGELLLQPDPVPEADARRPALAGLNRGIGRQRPGASTRRPAPVAASASRSS